MSKKTVKKTVKPLGPKPVAKRADAGDAIVAEEFEAQAGQLSATVARQSSGPTLPVQSALTEPPPPVAVPKPLTPLAALWPSSAPSKSESKPFPSSPVQEHSSALLAPKAALSLQPPQATAAAATAPKACNVRFELLEPNAKRVALCGDFNHWAANATPLSRAQDGRWATTLVLAPGRYEYKFLVDGIWIPDPSARENVWNYHGTLNSVIEVRA
jgi:hypothetical protein